MAEELEKLSLTEEAEGGGEGGAEAAPTPPAADAAATPEDKPQDEAPAKEGAPEDAEAAVPGIKLFVGGLQAPTTEKSLEEYFSTFGQVVEAVVKFNRVTGGPRGYGFVLVRGPEVAEAICAREHEIDGYSIPAPTLAKTRGPPAASADGAGRGRRGRHPDRSAGAPREAASQCKVFVGGLSHDTTIEDFKEFFEKFGPLEDSVIMYDHVTNRPRGFGFVTFTSADSVTKLLQSSFHELNGRRVEVKPAVPREHMPPPEPRAGRFGGREPGANPLAARRMPRGDAQNVVMPHYSFNSYSPEPVGGGYGGQEFSDQYGAAPSGIPVQPGVAPGGLPFVPAMPPPAGVAPLLPMPGAALPLPGAALPARGGGAPTMPAALGELPGMGRGGGNAPRQYGGAPALPAFLSMQPGGVAPYGMQTPGAMPSAMLPSGPGILPVGGPSALPEQRRSPKPGGAAAFPRSTPMGF